MMVTSTGPLQWLNICRYTAAAAGLLIESLKNGVLALSSSYIQVLFPAQFHAQPSKLTNP